MANYDGLTRNPWPGTWSTNGVHPIALDVELRGGLRLVSGSGTDTLVNIPSGMLQDGMLAYVASGYHVSISGDTYYKYSILSGESRDTETGFLPNDSGNWSVLSFGNGDALAVSGWADSTISAGDAAVSGWAQAYVDGQDHSATAVSGWAESYIDTTSGNLQSQINENASGIEAVSGIAVYASGHNLQTVTDNGDSTTNAITITNNNITASSGLFDSLDMTPLGNGQQPAYQEGVLFYDSENHTLTLYNDEADIALQIGQEQYVRVRNNTATTIENGTAVLINGVHGNAAPTISGAIATSEATSQVIGLATHSIEPNSFGYVTTYGVVRDVDTSAFSAGDELYLSATQIGSGVNTSPVIPNFKVTLGHVITSSSSNGSILVQVGNAKLGGGDVKSEGPLNVSGVPFITSTSDTTAGGSLTDPLFIFDSGNRQLQLASGVQLLDGEPSNTSNVLYNDGGVLKFDGSEIQTKQRTYNNISSDFSMSDDSDVVFIDSTSSSINIYLPTADGVGGKQLLFKMVSGSNSGVLVASGSQLIDGQSAFGIYNIYESISVISNNSNWFVI